MDNNKMRARSGMVNSDEQFVAFLYILMRDHLPSGVVEKIVREHCSGNHTHVFTNGWLAEYANDIASRLKNKQ